MSTPEIGTRRVREHLADPSGTAGLPVLVDRLWPRGVRKEALADATWAKDVAPSTELRRWFHGLDEEERDGRFEEFVGRYRDELDGNTSGAVDELATLVREHGTVTLLYGLKDTEHNHAQVLAEVLKERISG